ncbi:DEKNAAC101088 [Brettanomyces naardenensis]|uniref:Mediator of RNA polymerase II transcription subunit 7 n=1 Tax=Brettanomyces naardenensis TaxID=13370 RepID=A0A448YH64_BRENA|nr:DEKNAAC101088 [Brettanomyces naardenensis]
MTEENKDGLVSSLYPPPPPYIRFFTNKNVKKVKDLRSEGKTDEEISNIKDLRFLIPPKQPHRITYRSFGDVWPFEDRFITLKESGVAQLYNGGKEGKEGEEGEEAKEEEEEEEEEVFTQERIEELKKLTKSLLLNFLELVGILAKNPNYAFEKIDNIRIVLINLHHLLNSYRLHQSRESLILRIEDRLRQDREIIDKIEKTCQNVETKIRMLVLSGDIQFDTKEANDLKSKGKELKDETATDAETLMTDKKLMDKLKEETVRDIVKSIEGGTTND